MGYCKNCGQQLKENVKFCPKCGTAATASASTAYVNNDAKRIELNSRGNPTAARFLDVNTPSTQNKSVNIIPWSEVFDNIIANGIGLSGTQKVVIRLIWPFRKVLLLLVVAAPILSFFVDTDDGGIIRALILLAMCALWAFTFYYNNELQRKEYVPGNSFRMYRLNKEEIKKYALFSTLVNVVLAVLYVCFGDGTMQIISAIISTLIYLYYLYISLKYHEDVDYVTNQAIEDLLEMNIDESVVASYQNFDSSESRLCKGSNLIVVTNRKLFYAKFNGRYWQRLTKALSEISDIGVADYNNDKSYVEIVFKDHTYLELYLDMTSKFTSNPHLFIKQLLIAIDMMLLGQDVKPQSSRRRRISLNTTTPSPESKEENVRKIELDVNIIKDLGSAQQYELGRRIEL